MAEDPTRVAIAIGAGEFGGAERYVQHLARSLDDAGCDVTIVGSFPFEVAAGVGIVDASVGPKWARSTAAISLIRAWRERRTYLRQIAATDPQVVHAQFKREQILLTRKLARSGRRVVWTEHGAFPGGAYGWAMGRAYRRASRDVAAIICVSEHVRRWLHEDLGVDDRKLVVVPNPVDVQAFAPSSTRRAASRAALNLPESAIVVLTTSRLNHLKGVDRAVAAVRELSDEFILLVAGEGDAEISLREAAHDLGPRVRFLGFRSDVPEVMAAADVFLFTSRAEALEGQPLTILEAMASGLPVVATVDSGVGDTVIAWGGHATEPTPKALAVTIRAAVENQSLLSERMRSSVAPFAVDAWGRRTTDLLVGLST